MLAASNGNNGVHTIPRQEGVEIVTGPTERWLSLDLRLK